MVKLITEDSIGKNPNTLVFLKYHITFANNSSISGYIILYKINIIVKLTEVLVSYIGKFNVLHTAPVHCWNFSRDKFNVGSSASLLTDASWISGANVLEASYWLI